MGNPTITSVRHCFEGLHCETGSMIYFLNSAKNYLDTNAYPSSKLLNTKDHSHANCAFALTTTAFLGRNNNSHNVVTRIKVTKKDWRFSPRSHYFGAPESKHTSLITLIRHTLELNVKSLRQNFSWDSKWTTSAL